jgi:FKBP12-rapamycin complex-associated protein
MDSKDIIAMLNVLTELHEAMNDSTASISVQKKEGFSESIGKIGNITLRDISFRQNYGQMLSEAQLWLEMFRKTGKIAELHQAWEIYQLVFKRIKVQITTLQHLELDHVSPALMNAKHLTLAVPGTYKPSCADISITAFSPSIGVIASKQRPRRMSLLGSDGNHYEFLLKGHEDLRQDERVMQLFGLISVCLENDRSSNIKGLSFLIVRYSVLPLSNNSGLIGWVQNCDTINQLVKTYRESNGIKVLHLEAKMLNSKSINYDKLPLMNKVEAFKQVCEETSGQDLSKMLWLKSKSCDVWIERRANFTKSLAVMSMVGYILGLGDRHPSNLMIGRLSGRVVHIDFGDCFEITSQRTKYPEIVPFRLTRMLTECMEASGIEGTFRLTCERVIICFYLLVFFFFFTFCPLFIFISFFSFFS